MLRADFCWCCLRWALGLFVFCGSEWVLLFLWPPDRGQHALLFSRPVYLLLANLVAKELWYYRGPVRTCEQNATEQKKP